MRLTARIAWGSVWLAVVCLAAGSATRVLAQTATTGAIVGTIEDPQGKCRTGRDGKSNKLVDE